MWRWCSWSGNDGDGKNWVYLGHVLELRSTELVEALNVGDEGKRRLGDDP